MFAFVLYFCFLFSVFLYCCCVFVVHFSPFVYSRAFPISIQVYRPVPPGGNPVAVNKFHIISKRNFEKERVKTLTGGKWFRTVSGLFEHDEGTLGIT